MCTSDVHLLVLMAYGVIPVVFGVVAAAIAVRIINK